uniref:Peptidase M13 C-terminal domain-containing protein n=2 Tax=Ixodes scapularis TaxID=6945 RepID=A0A1S4KS06_IXOSC
QRQTARLLVQAYKKWVKENGPEAGLPGLKYTPQQLFWISAANVWCGKSRPETLKLSILAGSHSPGRFRYVAGRLLFETSGY